MEHSTDFFKDEVRNGFYIPTAIKQAWAAELDVLFEIDKVCLKHSIKYFADWGTILGAVRHGGFVPWDDDLDICMLRDDYEKFRKVADSELPKNYVIHDYERKENHWLFLSRVVNNSKMCFDLSYLNEHNNFPWLAGVDIFVKDYLFTEDDKELQRDKEVLTILAVADGIIEGRTDNKTAIAHLDGIKKKYRINLPGLQNRRDVGASLYRLAERQMAKVEPDKTDRVGQIFPFVLKNGIASAEKKEFYESLIRLPFEDTTIPVPAAYNTVLSKRYGNYNEIHKIWGGHNYPFFEGQKAEMEALSGEKFPGFAFNPGMLVRPEVSDTASLKKLSSNYNEKLKELLADAKKALQNRNLDEFTQKVSDTQVTAADFGTLVEQVKGEESECAKNVVSALQHYCDIIFDEYQAAINADKEIEMTNSLSAFSSLEETVQSSILQRKEILFLPTGPKDWNALKKYYDAIDDKNTDVVIVPLPVMKKSFLGDILMTEDEIEDSIHWDDYPDDLVCADWKVYDPAKHCPDIVFTENPYDDANPCLTVPPAFYAKNLRKYSGRIIFVPIAKTSEFGENDTTDRYNLKHYAASPGVIFADEVHVQSKNIKKHYVSALCGLAGNETKEIWEKKILAAEGTDESVPSKQKKGLCYCIGANELTEHPNVFCESVSKRLDILEDAGKKLDVSIMLYPNSRKTWESVNAGLSGKIFDLIERAVSERNFKLFTFDQLNADNAAADFDAYYGSPSPLVPAFVVQHKPVMLADYGIGQEGVRPH